MKYLKLFESFNSIEELVNDANDICLELNDNNIRTECYYNNPYVLNGESQPGFITVGMEKMYGDNEFSYDADILEGASGGMLINLQGQVVGIVIGVTGKHADVGVGENAACPSNKIKGLLV